MKKVSKIMDTLEQKKLAIINNPAMSEEEKMAALDELKNNPEADLVPVPVSNDTVIEETNTVDIPVVPTNSPEMQEILNNPNFSEEEKLEAINELSQVREAEMNKAIEERDPETVRRMMQQMQAMIAGMGIKSPNMFDGFKFPKPRKEKQPNAELQSAAEAKRARKAAKNLALVQKKALAKA